MKIRSCRLILYILSMPSIHFSDFENFVSSVNNSMTEIVVFVCPRLYSQYHIRSRPYLSPSTQQMSSINVLSCCPVDHTGSPKRSAHHIQPSDRLHSTGVIPSNLYSISSIALNFRMWWSSHHIAYTNQRPASIVFIQNGCLVTMHGSCRSVFLHFEGLCTDIKYISKLTHALYSLYSKLQLITARFPVLQTCTENRQKNWLINLT